MNAIEEFKSKELVYEFLPIIREKFNSNEPIVSIIIDCYYGLDLAKQSIQSVLNQDYQNVEIVLVDNGAKENVSKYLHHIYTRHKNIALIKFKENQFSWNDLGLTVINCVNPAILNCKGSIVTHLSYDDTFSLNCVSRMARLFIENENCVTAGPVPVSVDIDGNINKEFSNMLRLSNRRPRYIDGKSLALDYINNSTKKYFAAPGGILFIRKDILIKYGGYDRDSDVTQVIKLAIHGDSGFDSEAKLFWRHHSSQVNKMAKRKGIIWCDNLPMTVKSENIIDIWERLFTKEEVKLLRNYIRDQNIDSVLSVTNGLLRQKNLIGFIASLKNIIKQSPSLFFYVIGFSFLEVLKMFYEKIFSSARNI